MNPVDSLSDQKIHINIVDLPASSKVTLRASLISDIGDVFQSYGYYISDDHGRVKVYNDSCFGGTYNGIQAMGLLSSMVSVTGKRKGNLNTT